MVTLHQVLLCPNYITGFNHFYVYFNSCNLVSGKVAISFKVTITYILTSKISLTAEYAYTLHVNEKSDIYSFGVVILELVTGRRPVGPEFGEKDLATWVHTTLNEKGVDQLLDPNLNSTFKEHICKVLDIGLCCLNHIPANRPSMRRVVKMLQESFPYNVPGMVNKNGKLLPYFFPKSV